MITIHHNFDETKFQWLWARYVKSGNIEKHCVNSIPGTYSKKFSGASNKDLLSQPMLVMDEVPDGSYEAIYFCGVLKKGYLNKNPLKNNYRHNVHFAVRPQTGAHDVWDFENWHVEIDDGVLEHIPETYELKEKFFHDPYTPHFYTCRIFRWMVGHFYPNELENIFYGYPKYMIDATGNEIDIHEAILKYIQLGKAYVYYFIMEDQDNIFGVDDTFLEHYWQLIKEEVEKTQAIKLLGSDTAQKIKDKIMKDNLLTRHELTIKINKALENKYGNRYILPQGNRDACLTDKDMEKFFALGIEEALDMIFPYQSRRLIL